jgi:hypothetical protein
MFIRKLAALAAIAALSLLALGAMSASASTALRTDPSGGRLTGSTTITNTTSHPAVLQTDKGTVTCNSTKFDADVTSNNSATSISGTLTQLTFTTCTDTIPVVAINSCHLATGNTPSVSIAANATGGHVTLTDVLARCVVAGSASGCYYTGATATGVATNATSVLSYNNISAIYPVTNPADGIGAAICGTNALFSVTLTHIVQGGTNATITITTA